MACRCREEHLLELCGYRVEQRGRDRVLTSESTGVFAGETLSDRVGISLGVISDRLCSRIEEGVDAGEITGDIGVRRKSVITMLVVMVHRLVIVEIEEHLVLQNRTADRSTEVVVAQEWNWLKPRGFRKTEFVGVCRKGVILNEIVSRPMELIGTALGDLVKDDSADPVLRREGRRIDLQFGNVLEGGWISILAV